MATGVLEQRMTTSPEAARAYRAGVNSLLQLRQGSLQHFARALALDPTFALAHAALALIGHELGAPVDVRTRVTMAQLHGRRASESERSHIWAVAQHVGGDRSALVRHLQAFPGDAVLLAVAVPTFAFTGVTDTAEDAWQLVESCTSAQSGTWFHDGLLAFVRQEQGRYDEAMDLATRSMTYVPGSGHAAHARAHVHYETGDHQAGLDWLDAWIDGDGRDTDHRTHFAWHAALHELSRGDLAGVAHRYRTQLSTAEPNDCRSLVDAGSLLWRWALTPGATGVPLLAEATTVSAETLLRPGTPFVGVHAAFALAAAEDAPGLRSLACWSASQEQPALSSVVSPLASALRLLVLDQPSACADELIRLRPVLHRVGGSSAQREIVEETLVSALLGAHRYDEARALVDDRLDRRPSRRDQWFRDAAAAGVASADVQA